MATTTPNFGWAVPTSTDLVKDGAVAIETLGDSIDASLVDLKGGTSGQVLKKNSNTDMDFIWSADSAGMTNPMTTTGDTIYSSSGSTPARLGIGSTGQVLTVAGGVPTWASAGASEPVSFWARQSSSQSFTASTWTKIDFGSEQFDSDNYFASSRFTPLKAGYYNLSVGLSFEGSGSGLNITAIYKNGSQDRAINRYNTDGNCIVSASGMVYFNGSTDYAEIYVYSTRTSPSIGVGDSNGFYGTFIHS
jgi:hypothetical protein